MICAAGAAIGEGPVLHDGLLRWSDPIERRLLSIDREGEFRSAEVERAVWSLAVLRDGGLAATLDDRLALVEVTGRIELGPAAALSAGTRFNDMAVGPDGALWAGVMHRAILATQGGIFRAAAPGSEPRRVADGLGVPNGMAVSADGAILYMVDTLHRTLIAFPIVGEELGDPAIVTDFLDLPGKPDGMTIDRAGRFHVAMWGGACVAHIDVDGATLGVTPLPAPHVSSLCATEDGRLLVTTSRMRLSAAMLSKYPLSGAVFEISAEEFP